MSWRAQHDEPTGPVAYRPSSNGAALRDRRDGTQELKVPHRPKGRPLKPRRRGGFIVRTFRALGWLCILAGLVVLLYLVYSLLFTNLQTDQAQADLLEQWQLQVGDPAVPAAPAAPPVLPGEPPPAAPPATPTPLAPVDPGQAVAVLQFLRAGTGEAIVNDQPLFVVEGVGAGELQRGPGHYPATDQPGGPGNFAVAGHRTTFGAPFYNLDVLAAGDEIRVTARSGQVFTYRVMEQRVVTPNGREVLAPNPRGTGRPTLTLTTCHPRFSNAQRLVVFAELI
jgi:sortase A